MPNLRLIGALFALLYMSPSAAEQTLRVKCNGTVSYSVTPFEFDGLGYNYLGDPLENSLRDIEFFAEWRITDSGNQVFRMRGDGVSSFAFQDGNMDWGTQASLGRNILTASQTCGDCWGKVIYNTLLLWVDRQTAYVTQFSHRTVIGGSEPWNIREIKLADDKSMKCVKANRAL